jgi:L-ribulose-5-phosphate 3-epimerase
MRLLSICFCAFIISLLSCNSSSTTTGGNDAGVNSSASFDPKLGIALWTFHTVDFPASLDLVSNAGVRLIEANTFHKAGADLKDSLVGQLSDAGLASLNEYIRGRNLELGSVYLGGGNTVEAWKRDFETAKKLNARFVTAEPPVNMWDAVDSLAGVYGLRVAIHDHWKGTSAYWHPDSVLAAIQGHPNFGACADLGHWPKSGVNPTDAVKKLSGHIIAVHLKDIAEYNNTKIQDVRVGTGIVDFPAVFAELKKQSFTGNIYIERDTQEPNGNLESVKETVKYYNEQMAKLKP